MKLCVLLLLLPSQLCFGQLNSGTVTGTVTDSSDAVIQGAAITLTNDQTGDVRKAVSTDSGTFTMPGIPAGI